MPYAANSKRSNHYQYPLWISVMASRDRKKAACAARACQKFARFRHSQSSLGIKNRSAAIRDGFIVLLPAGLILISRGVPVSSHSHTLRKVLPCAERNKNENAIGIAWSTIHSQQYNRKFGCGEHNQVISKVEDGPSSNGAEIPRRDLLRLEDCINPGFS